MDRHDREPEKEKKKRMKSQNSVLTAKGLMLIASVITSYQALNANEFPRVFWALGQRQVRSTDILKSPLCWAPFPVNG